MSDLTDRMRTCAATIAAATGEAKMRACEDAAELLVEAGVELAAAIAEDIGPLGAPMEILEPVKPRPAQGVQGDATDVPEFWIAPGAALPGLKHSGTVSLRPCPNCYSRTQKKVFRSHGRMMIECPVCCTRWALQGAA